MKIVIVGCGRVGINLAEVLDTDENEITVVDNDPKSFKDLPASFQGTSVSGLGFDEDVLNQAGIQTCDVFCAVTNKDNVNLMASEVARRIYGVPHVLVRLVEPARADLYQQLGFDYICGTELVAESMAAKIRARSAHHLETFGEYEVLKFALALSGSGVMHVRDLEAIGQLRVTLYEHDGQQYLAAPGMFLHDGDTILAVAHESVLPELAAYMKGEDKAKAGGSEQATKVVSPAKDQVKGGLSGSVVPGSFFKSREGK